MSHPSDNALRATLAAWWRAVMRFVTQLLGKPAQAHAAAPAKVQESSHFIPINELQCLDNFYHLEAEPDIGHWRWTGPGCSFSLFVPVARDRDQTIVMEALGTLSPINWGNTFLEVENEMLLCEHSEVNGRHWLSATLPHRANGNGAFVRYHLQDSRRPQPNADGSRDGRKLGFAMTGLRIIPN